MSCQNDCDLVCLQCDQLFCLIHGREHHKEPNHIVQMADEKKKSMITQKQIIKALKTEKKKQIHQITWKTSLAISNLQNIAQMQINSVKKAKSLGDLQFSYFKFENYLLSLAQAGILHQGIYSISKNEVYELTQTIKGQNLENIFRNIKRIQSLLYEYEEEKKKAIQGTN